MIGLGSNLGDRLLNLARATRAIRRIPGVKVTAVSSVYRTAPMGKRRQPWFYNAAARVVTALPPAALLGRMKKIEKSLGRRRGGKCSPRVIDLDLLLHGRRIVKNRGVTVPHPRMHERAFVLAPCVEIAGRMPHPEIRASLRRLASHNRARGRVERLGAGEQALFRKAARGGAKS